MRDSDRRDRGSPAPARKMPSPAPDAPPSAREPLTAPPPAARPVPARESVHPPPKPIPVRDGGPPPRPAPANRGAASRPPKPAERDTPGPRKPPAAREASPPSARDLDRAGPRTEPARDVRLGEETWRVRLKGAATVGSGHAGARILSVGFEAPEDRADPVETRYVLARRLEEVSEDELLTLVREVARQPVATSGSSRRRRRGSGRQRRRRRGRT